MLYGREPVLPIDVTNEFTDCTSITEDPEFEESDFLATLSKLEKLQVYFSFMQEGTIYSIHNSHTVTFVASLSHKYIIDC